MLLWQNASAIICRCTLEEIQISLGKSLDSCQVPRWILKAVFQFWENIVLLMILLLSSLVYLPLQLVLLILLHICSCYYYLAPDSNCGLCSHTVTFICAWYSYFIDHNKMKVFLSDLWFPSHFFFYSH